MTRLSILMLLAIAAAFVFAIVSVARAHGWYDPACCSDQDCAPIPADAVSFEGGRIIIELDAGEHFMAPNGGFWEMEFDHRIRPSQDGHYHFCILPKSQRAQCLYVPGLA